MMQLVVFALLLSSFVFEVKSLEEKAIPFDFANATQLLSSPHVNAKFINKYQRFMKTGTLSSKKDTPTMREEHWSMMRTPKYETGLHPSLYVNAKRKIDQLPTSPRFSNKRFNQFQNIGPTSSKIDGGRTRALLVQGAMAPYTLFAGGVAGGIWKSVNSGDTWTLVTDTLPNIAISCFATPNVNPSPIIYAGTGEAFFNGDARRGIGIFKSVDFGQTWDILNATLISNFSYVSSIQVSSNNSDVIYVSTRGGVWKSVDAGDSFHLVLASFPNSTGFLDLKSFHNEGEDVILTWMGRYGLFVSNDSGITWEFKFGAPDGGWNQTWHRGSIGISKDGRRSYVSVSSLTPGNIMGLWRSDDFGETWNQTLLLDSSPAGKLNQLLMSYAIFGFDNGNFRNCINSRPSINGQGWYSNVVGVDPINPDIVFVGGIDFWRSDDGGVTFGLISTWWAFGRRYLHADQHAIVFSPNFANDTTIFFANDGGISFTTNPYDIVSVNPCVGYPSVAWNARNEGYGTIQFYHGSVSPTGTVMIGGTQDNGSWKFISDTTWTIVTGGDGGFTAIDFRDPTRFYTSNTGTTITRVTTTTTSILSSGQIGGDGSFINPFIMDPNDSSILYTCSESVWKSSDATRSPVTWTNIGTLDPPNNGTKPTALTITNDSLIIYVADAQPRFWKLEVPDQPRRTGQGLPQGIISSITIDPTNKDIIYVTISTFRVPHLYKSVDGGETFVSIGDNIPDVPCLCLFVHPQDPTILYLGTDLGILYSDDGGNLWTNINRYGFATTPAQWFAYQASTNSLFIFTHGRGVYKLDVSLTPRVSTGGISTGAVTSAAITSNDLTTLLLTTGKVASTGSRCGVCPPNSYCEGMRCVCDSGYTLLNGDCVGMESAAVSKGISFLLLLVLLYL